jgi:hypothetical protein
VASLGFIESPGTGKKNIHVTFRGSRITGLISVFLNSGVLSGRYHKFTKSTCKALATCGLPEYNRSSRDDDVCKLATDIKRHRFRQGFRRSHLHFCPTFILSSRPRAFYLILSQLLSVSSNEKCVYNSLLRLLPSRLSLQCPVRLPLPVLASESSESSTFASS